MGIFLRCAVLLFYEMPAIGVEAVRPLREGAVVLAASQSGCCMNARSRVLATASR